MGQKIPYFVPHSAYESKAKREQESSSESSTSGDEDVVLRRRFMALEREGAGSSSTFVPIDIVGSSALAIADQPPPDAAAALEGKPSVHELPGPAAITDDGKTSSKFPVRFHTFGRSNFVKGKHDVTTAVVRAYSGTRFLAGSQHCLELDVSSWSERFGYEAQQAGHIGSCEQLFCGFAGSADILPYVTQLKRFLEQGEAERWTGADVVCVCHYGKHRSVALASVLCCLLRKNDWEVGPLVHHSRAFWHRQKCGWRHCPDCDDLTRASKVWSVGHIAKLYDAL
jgi:hypothetical protein